MQVLFMMFNNCFWLVAWYFMFEKVPTIAGFHYADYMLLWVICCRSFSFVMMLGNGSVYKMGDLIAQGGIDTYLLLPGSVLPKIVGRSIEISAIGDFFFSIILIRFIPGVSLIFAAKILIVSLLSAVVIVGVMIIFQSLSFWIGNSTKLADSVFQAMIGSATYPPEIFSSIFLKILIVTVVPVYFTAFMPYTLVKHFSWIGFGELALVAACVIVLAAYIFKRGLRRYESGSAMVLNV